MKRLICFLVSAWILASTASAQSTLGVILGTVRDASGGSVAGATVKITNVGENTSRDTKTNTNGDYEFQNAKAGIYTVAVTQPGFKGTTASNLTLAARQTLRVDAALEVGEFTQTVEVSANAGVIATDTGAVSSTLTPEKLLGLPVNVRGGTSTSPYAIIAALPGVQSDNGGGYAIQGGVPAQTESTTDGISITAVTGNSPNRNMFPSMDSIAEIKVQGVGNAAEYGTPGDVTTISKSGTNEYHGALFWYHQNRAMDSRAFNQVTLPAKVSNTFGFTIGGPVWIPKLYQGKNKTFFLFTYEGFRLPRQSTINNRVPTARMKAGNFSSEVVGNNNVLRDPFASNAPFANNTIPTSRFNAAARAVLPFYPDPNFGNLDRVVAINYVDNRRADIRSNQFDARVDQQFGTAHTVFGRYSQKENPSTSPNNLLLPADTGFNNYKQFMGNYTWTIKPNLLNQFIGGLALSRSGAEFPFDGRGFMNSLNFQDIQKDIFFNALPNFSIDQIQSFNKGRPGRGVSWNSQFIDNLTWTTGRHTFKFGGDIRKLRAESNLGFTTGDNYGDYVFRGGFTGAPFADFLLGTPVETSVAVVQFDNDGRATHYKFYAQDSFRWSRRLTLEYGARWEFHPGYSDAGFNIANFDRNTPRTGRVVIPSDPNATKLLSPAVLATINACPGPTLNGAACTPIVTAKDAGLPEGLRENYYTQFLPRAGFAYRWNDKTTIRGNFGMFNMILLGSVFFSLTGTVTSDVRSFSNVGASGAPVFTLPQTRPANASGVRAGNVGSFEFRTANQIDFRPPQMYQWSFTVDRELTSNTGARFSYIANKSTHMPWAPDLNQAPSSTTYFSQRPLSDRPFPHWGLIYTRDAGANSIFNSFQGEVNRRFSSGLTYNFAYTFSKHLGDAAGPNPSGFAGETGGGRVTNSYDRRADRGDVYATRRHRMVNSIVYNLPFGKGRKYLAKTNAVTDAVLGGWSLSSLMIIQSGPFMTPTVSSATPPAPTRLVAERSVRTASAPPTAASPRPIAHSGSIATPSTVRAARKAPPISSIATSASVLALTRHPSAASAIPASASSPDRARLAGIPACRSASCSPNVSACAWKARSPTCRTGPTSATRC